MNRGAEVIPSDDPTTECLSCGLLGPWTGETVWRCPSCHYRERGCEYFHRRGVPYAVCGCRECYICGEYAPDRYRGTCTATTDGRGCRETAEADRLRKGGAE